MTERTKKPTVCARIGPALTTLHTDRTINMTHLEYHSTLVTKSFVVDLSDQYDSRL